MARNLRFLWVLLPYLAVFWGMMLTRSAWGALIGFHLALLPLLLPNWKQARRLLAPVSRHILLPLTFGGLAAGPLLWLLWPLGGILPDYPARVEALRLRCETWPLFLAYFSLVNPFLEEWYWRGVLGNDSPRPRLIDFLFAGYHIIIMLLFAAPVWVCIGFLVLAGVSWGWRQSVRLSGSLLPAALSHLLADVSVLSMLYVLAC
ncbi:MAG: hypothetical protein NZP74_11085 [Anaerolineales bacterium]|nr:hypothetical protein [Anaerolineales bacterium]MDW8277702.1 hypothetical protein [Anaerolineales bacterium]